MNEEDYEDTSDFWHDFDEKIRRWLEEEDAGC